LSVTAPTRFSNCLVEYSRGQCEKNRGLLHPFL
jgi:hypothetical protein